MCNKKFLLLCDRGRDTIMNILKKMKKIKKVNEVNKDVQEEVSPPL